MKAFIIQHLKFEDLGNIEPELIKKGYDIYYFFPGNPDHLEILRNCTAELLIILGGPIGAYEDSLYPFLSIEKEIIENYINNNKPVLGICLGAQLIASVLGANVFPGGEKEIGWSPVQLNREVDIAWLPKNLDEENVLHWHGDTFELPHKAIRIASSEKYENQGFIYNSNILALQFHLEVLPKNIENWLIGHTMEINKTDGISVESLRAQTRAQSNMMQEKASNLWSSWFDFIKETQKNDAQGEQFNGDY